jgi:hypothetical protein
MSGALRSRSALLGLLGLIVLGGLAGYAPGNAPSVSHPPVAKGGPNVTPYIRGYLVIGNAGKTGERTAAVSVTEPIIFVPGVSVSLVDSTTGAIRDTVTTDLSGRFTFWGVKSGLYRVCWKARGFRSDCFANPIPVKDRPFNLKWAPIAVQRTASTTVVFGSVSVRSGTTRTFEPSIGVNAFTRVFLVDLRGRALDSAYVNNLGDYILPAVPANRMLRVEGRLEGARVARSMVAEFLSSAASHRVDLTIANFAPRFADFMAASGGRRVRTAATGATIALSAQANDADGDPVSYRWRVPQGGGTLSATTGANVNWTLPAKPGLYRVDAVASDGRGGYAKQYALVSTTGQGVAFSGLVNATDAPSVPKAEVDINGVTVLTNGAGRFLVRVPEADRYVVNVRKAGYKLLSQIYQDALEGGTWTLARGTVRTVDPTQPIDVVDDRKYQRCGSVLTRVSKEQAAKARQAVYEDKRGYVTRVRVPRESQTPPREQGCGPGLRLQIPANALVDANGNAPAGPVDVTVYTTDLRTPFDMPGDYTVLDAGQTRVMESYGAGHIEVQSGGTRYNLKTGTTATLTLPIDPSQLAAPGAKPATIPLLAYDEKRGVWVRDGTLQRVGSAYVGAVKHFSDFNSDMVKVNQACIRIFSGPEQGLTQLPAQYNIEITVPQGTAAPRFFSRQMVNTDPFYHAFYNLPTNTDVTLLVYSTDAPPNTIVYGTFIVNTGGVQNPATPNRPAPNYGACQGAVVLFDASEPTPGTDAFLHGLYSFEAANLTELLISNPALAGQFDVATANYYQRVDPRGLRTNYAAFLSKNGFAFGNHDSATYVNAADLAFGREMHCKRTPASDNLDDDIACYVTNYGDQNGSNTDDDGDFSKAANRTDAFATVAMEYSRIENAAGDPVEFDPTDHDRVVKFYVYQQPTGIIQNKADLDGVGARPVPQLCMVCHGGEYPSGRALGVPTFNSKASVKMGSVFIPFDLRAFHFVDGVVPAYDKANQQAAFKALNQTHVYATRPGAVITEVIDSMYNPPTAATQSETFVVQGWRGNAGQQAMYSNVIAPSCRMCHGSRPEPAVAPFGLDLRFNDAVPFISLGPTVPFRVCVGRVMPHALATYNRFWTSVNPHQPGQLTAFGDAQVPGGYGTNCVTSPVILPPPTVVQFAANVQPILNTNCVPCHNNTNHQAQLNMDAAVAYGNLVNQPATELTTMFRIKPGDPANSYLIHKINGTQGPPVGGSGVRMPPGGALSASDIQTITKWVQDGAVP